MELVIRGARVVDGGGGAAYRADVGIDGGRFAIEDGRRTDVLAGTSVRRTGS